MLHQMILFVGPATHVTSPGLGINLGTLLSGIAALLLAIGSGVGAFIRYRKAARDAKNVQTEVREISNQEIKEAAIKLEAQYEARLAQADKTIDLLREANKEQAHMYEERLANLQAFNTTLLAQILKHRK